MDNNEPQEPQKFNPAGHGGACKITPSNNALKLPLLQGGGRVLFAKVKAVRYRLRLDDGQEVERTITARQTARTLAALVHKGEAGVTALEMSGWALRLAEYIRALRHDYGMVIVTLREDHDGGQHGRYVLKTPVEILDIVTA